MRWFEIKEMDQDPQEVESAYAEIKDNKAMAAELKSADPDGRYDDQAINLAQNKPVRHIRAFRVSVNDVKNAIKSVGGVEKAPDSKQATLSGQYPVIAFEKDKVKYAVVVSSKGLDADNPDSFGLARKETAPSGLGIPSGMYKRQELIDITRERVEKRYRNKNPQLADTLLALLDNADGGGKGSLPSEQMQYISSYLGTLSQDYGEILAPLLMTDGNDEIEIPSGNEALVDVKIPGKGNISVKALSGSGTSFKAIAKYMDEYEKAIEQEPDEEKKERFNILKQFHPKSGGKNVDKIIKAVKTANTQEYQELEKILGTSPDDYKSLVNAVQNKTGDSDYTTFLKTFYPMMVAGPWGKPVGLPADGKYYMDPKGDAPKAKQAGKPNYDVDPAKGGANIITYALSVGLLNYIRKGDDAEKYKDMMTNIVQKADAVLGHITIKSNGQLELTTTPFSDLEFNFQYHAPSHLPGNNLPGFMAIL